MAITKWQVVFEGESGLPRDVISNSFHFEGDKPDAANVADMLEDFYLTAPNSGGSTLISRMSAASLGTSMTIRGYDLEDAEPRVPFYSRTVAISPGSGEGLPSELALVMSFQAEQESGQSQARRRNRVYLGPFTLSETEDERPSAQLIAQVAACGRELLVAANSSVNWKWVVYSPTTAAGSSPAAAYWDVDNGWVDDAWDVQRRRGIDPSSRTIFTPTLPA